MVNVTKSGCKLLVHHFEIVAESFPNCSYNHLLVRFFSTNTTFVGLFLYRLSFYYTQHKDNGISLKLRLFLLTFYYWLVHFVLNIITCNPRARHIQGGSLPDSMLELPGYKVATSYIVSERLRYCRLHFRVFGLGSSEAKHREFQSKVWGGMAV